MSPGHELNCPFVIAMRKVDGVGINMQAWKYPARCCLVCEFGMIPRARLFVGVKGVGGEVGVSRMFHMPLMCFHLLFMMILTLNKNRLHVLRRWFCSRHQRVVRLTQVCRFLSRRRCGLIVIKIRVCGVG